MSTTNIKVSLICSDIKILLSDFYYLKEVIAFFNCEQIILECGNNYYIIIIFCRDKLIKDKTRYYFIETTVKLQLDKIRFAKTSTNVPIKI